MRGWILGITIGLALVAGCSQDKAVLVSGDIKTSSGKPVTGVRLILAPAEESTMSPIGSFGFELDDNGHFEGRAMPGKYVFYLSTVSVQRDDDDGKPVNAAEAKKLKASTQVLKAIPAVYHAAKTDDPARIVEVTSGATLALTVNR